MLKNNIIQPSKSHLETHIINNQGMEELNEEIAQLEKRKRILQLRKEIASLENTLEQTEPRPRIDFTDIQHAIVPFTDGDTAYGIKK